ncbi:MAG: hypothetical protein KGL46_09770 [Hyphomicrobiales bacterium]|nr:hypothetical protein [Hyphomicrobiales bacterium]
MRKSFLIGATVVLAGFVTSAKADTYGCTVLLCTAPGAGDWTKIPACAGPVSTALAQAYLGVPWPQCPEAAVSAATSQAIANNPSNNN